MKSFPVKICIFLYCALLFSFGAQKSSLEFKGDENFYFESTRHMLETKDILTPRYMNEERFQKPILFYWFILLSFKIFGVNWFAARLPSILLGSLCALLIFKIAELLFRDKKTALFAALFAATTPLYYRYARLAVPDMSLIFFETLALYFFINYYKFRTGTGLRFFFAALAVAFLIKGPVGVLIPLLITAIFCLLKKETVFKLSDVAAGVILFLVITVPWFYAMWKIYPERYANEVVSREILQRLGWGHAGSFIMVYIKGFIFYTVTLITKFLPYSLFMPFAFAGVARNSRSENDGRIFLLTWVAVVFLFFTFVAERRTHYLLALAPAASILVGVFFAKLAQKKRVLPIGIVAFLSLLYIAFNLLPAYGLFSNRMEHAAFSIKAGMKEGDRIGIGSHGIIPEELQVFFQVPVELVKVTYTADGRPSMDTVPRLKEFLNSQDRVFCVIKKKDYETFLPAEMREKLYIIDSYYVWKRRITFNEVKDAVGSEGGDLFKEVFQNEIYVVSNKR
ncbi:MAG: glycosyltransferase family 39 protein [Candidatus Omnitrophica bacterium]|nr:glycosyltransferase family 39 protein [Candidatus Omnitrophota bacterium]